MNKLINKKVRSLSIEKEKRDRPMDDGEKWKKKCRRRRERFLLFGKRILWKFSFIFGSEQKTRVMLFGVERVKEKKGNK